MKMGGFFVIRGYGMIIRLKIKKQVNKSIRYINKFMASE